LKSIKRQFFKEHISLRSVNLHWHEAAAVTCGCTKKLKCKTTGIGPLIYFLQHNNILNGVLGFLKALVWPAVLIYNLMEFLKCRISFFAPDHIGIFWMTKVIACIIDSHSFL
jgi:hypothetical protein